MYWAVHTIILIALSFLLWRFSKSNIPTPIFLTGLGLKLGAGIVLGLIFYKYYGSGDTIIFFEAARSSGSLNQLNQPRTEFFIYLITPLVKLSGGSYWISSLWLSFISFCGCWYLVNTLIHIHPKIKSLALGCFLFIPTVIFWSSGILKDTLAFSAIAVIVAVIHIIYHKKRVNILEILLLLVGGFILVKLKHYLFITILLYSGLMISFSIIKILNSKWKWALVLTTILAMVVGSQIVHPYLKIDRLAWAIYENNKAITVLTESSKRLDLEIENGTWQSVINEIPTAIQIGLFRPSFFDQVPKWGLIHQVENFILTTLIVFSIILLFKTNNAIDKPTVISAVVCILLLAVMLPLSTPNFGTLVRYKNAYLPYLFLISSILPYRYLTSTAEE